MEKYKNTARTRDFDTATGLNAHAHPTHACRDTASGTPSVAVTLVMASNGQPPANPPQTPQPTSQQLAATSNIISALGQVLKNQTGEAPQNDKIAQLLLANMAQLSQLLKSGKLNQTQIEQVRIHSPEYIKMLPLMAIVEGVRGQEQSRKFQCPSNCYSRGSISCSYTRSFCSKSKQPLS